MMMLNYGYLVAIIHNCNAQIFVLKKLERIVLQLLFQLFKKAFSINAIFIILPYIVQKSIHFNIFYNFIQKWTYLQF